MAFLCTEAVVRWGSVKIVLENFAKFTAKDLYQSLFSIKLRALYRTPSVTASVCND